MRSWTKGEPATRDVVFSKTLMVLYVTVIYVTVLYVALTVLYVPDLLDSGLTRAPGQ